MTVLTYTLGVLLFAVGVAVSIGLHEMGHLVPGKLFDVKVTQFFVGFGRTLWSTKRGETEYGVKAIPLGGYCKLVGMLPPGPDQDPSKVRDTKTGMFTQLVDDARSAEYEFIEEADKHRLFYNKPWWQRVIIMGSGVAINLLIAFFLFAVVFMGYGTAQATTSVETVSQCVIAVTKENLTKPQRACTSADPDSPAEAAGFLPGDRIVTFNGTEVKTWRQIQTEIRANGAETATIVVERDGKQVTLRPKTVVSTVPDLENTEQVTKAGFLGVVPTTVIERQGVGFVVTTMVEGTWQTIKAIGAMPVRLYHVARAALGLEERDANSPMSVVGAGRVAGEMASEHEVSFAARFFSVLALLAGLNLFLAMINLLPLPPFDGGGIATTLYEAARRGIAKLRHRPDPGAVDSAKLLPITYVMAALILVMTVLLVYADIVAPVSLT